MIIFFILSGTSGEVYGQYKLTKEYAQTRLDGWMCCNLDEVLMKISGEQNLKFKYDAERLARIEFKNRIINKPLGMFLDQVCKDNQLKFYMSPEDSVIHIVDRWFTLEQSSIQEIKTYTGGPKKFNFPISGTVIDKKTRESLPFVAIMPVSSKTGTTSNVDGYFSLLKVPTDTSTILFSYLGYQPKKIYLTPDTKTQELIIQMEPEAIGLEEVIVKGEKQDILQVSGVQTSMIKMSPIKLDYIPNLGEKDMLRSFQLMPGISAANENSSGLYVRGGTPDQVLVQYDGFTVYNVEHMFGFFSAFNSHAIKDIQLYKGGFDAKWGGRLASVVEITGKDGNQKSLNGAVDLSMMSVSGFVEFPVNEKMTVTLAGRRSWKSPLYTKIFDQFTEDNEVPMGGMGRFGQSTAQETKSYFYDLNGKITWRPNDKDIFSFSIYNGKDDLDNSISPQVPQGFPGGESFSMDMEMIDETNWGNTGASLKWSRQLSERFYMNSLLSYSNYYSSRVRSTSGSFVRGDEEETSISRGINEDNDLKDISVKSDFEYKLFENQQLEFGFQASHIDVDYNYIQNDTLTVVNRTSNGQLYSAYLQDGISLLSNKMVITPGLRLNYFSETNKFYYEPRINMIYSLSERFKLKAAAGKYYQFAKRVIREDITQGSVDFWVLSDDDLLPVSSSNQVIAGFSYETNAFLLDIEAFYKELDNVTEYSLRYENTRDGGPGRPNESSESIDYSENFFTGTGISRGIDFLIQKKAGDFTGWIGYTISQVTNNIPAFGNYDFYAAHDVRNEFKTVATYKWHRWNFGANWIYASGKPYTAPEGGYQLTLLDGNTADYINVSVKNGNRLPDYHRMDVSATYNFTLPNRSKASLGLSIFNLYNRSNIWYMTYEIVDDEIIETPVYYLGITPNISLTFKLK
ncbi:MAG: TonB-dependent receptor [Bacteroidales bacterium]|nr:TonB-dependent receptor [Bacteroidales bacterium]